MAKVKKFLTSSTKAAGGHYSISGDIQVDTEGKFYFKLEEDQIPFAKDYIKSGHKIEETNLRIAGRNRNNLYSDTMLGLETALKKICYSLSQSGVKEELIIMYRIENNVSYFKTGDGEILPNAQTCKNYVTDPSVGEWKGKHSSMDSLPSYAVKVYAQVVLRITQTGSTTVEYGNPNHATDENLRVPNSHGDVTGEKYEYLIKLNRFMINNVGAYSGPKPAELKVLPYTEQRAKFFYDLMIGMCKLADKFSVLEDENNVLQLADSGKSMLLSDNLSAQKDKVKK